MHVDAVTPGANEVGWFVARQPGLVRFLEDRCGSTDAFPVALEAAYRMCASLQDRDGVPPPPIPGALLERAEDSVEMESMVPGGASDGCAERQPALCQWVDALLDDPPLPLDPHELRTVAACLATVIYALDQLTTGRAIP